MRLPFFKKPNSSAPPTALGTDGGGSGLQRVRVHGKSPASKDAVLLDLRPVDRFCPLVAFDPGAHIDVHLDAQLVRQYSLVSDDAERYLVCVQHEPSGRGGSRAIHERIGVGDVLEVSRPRNTFPLAPATGPVVLLAGGVGITPLMAMSASLHRVGAVFELHAYAQSAEDLPLRSLLEESSFRDRVSMHYSSEGDSFRERAPLALSQPEGSGAIYVCGPAAFIDTARARALAAGWREDQIRIERFSAVPAISSPGEGSFTVVASSTGRAYEVGPEETIADVLERNGHDTYRSCGQGYCGSCVTHVLSGIPDHRDDSQTDAEHASNTRINVCCSRSLSPVLELDI